EAEEEAERTANDKRQKKNGYPTTDSTGDREGAEAENSQAEERGKGPYEDGTTT
ncbi:28222_t:CDS:1, partial [Racocetra persica]